MSKSPPIKSPNISRNATLILKNWLMETGRKPLILRGARQVGKSTLVKMFAEETGKQLIEVNLEKQFRIGKIFDQMDPLQIVQDLELQLKTTIDPKKAVLFIDEIQAHPQAIASLRYFYEDFPSLPVLAAGSLLDFALSEKKISIPVGRVQYAYISQISFEEFLGATGQTILLKAITQFELGVPARPGISETVHEHLLEQLQLFSKVGGMPQAVSTYLKTGSIQKVRLIQNEILAAFRDDFGKYSSGKELVRIQRLFDGFPAIMGKKIVYSHLSREDSARDIRSVIDLLVQARVLAQVYHSNCSALPLAFEQSESIYKLYHLDCGLMNAQLGTPLESQPIGQLLGLQAEQMVYQAIQSSQTLLDRRIYYWLREGKSENAELDFVIENDGKMLPIEVKSGKSGSLKSLFQFVAKSKCEKAIRFDLNPPSTQKIETQVTTGKGRAQIQFVLHSLPIYLAGQLKRLVTEHKKSRLQHSEIGSQ